MRLKTAPSPSPHGQSSRGSTTPSSPHYAVRDLIPLAPERVIQLRTSASCPGPPATRVQPVGPLSIQDAPPWITQRCDILSRSSPSMIRPRSEDGAYLLKDSERTERTERTEQTVRVRPASCHHSPPQRDLDPGLQQVPVGTSQHMLASSRVTSLSQSPTGPALLSASTSGQNTPSIATLCAKGELESSSTTQRQWRGRSPAFLQPQVVRRTGWQSRMPTGQSTPETPRTRDGEGLQRFITMPPFYNRQRVSTSEPLAHQDRHVPTPQVRSPSPEKQEGPLDLRLPTLSRTDSNTDSIVSCDGNRGVQGRPPPTQDELHDRLETLRSQFSVMHDTVAEQFKNIEHGLAEKLHPLSEVENNRSQVVCVQHTHEESAIILHQDSLINQKPDNSQGRVHGTVGRALSVSDKYGDMKEALEPLSSKCIAVEEALGPLSSRCTAMEEALGPLTNRCTAVEEALGPLCTRCNVMDEALGPLSTKCSVVEVALNRIQHQLDEHLGRICSLEYTSQTKSSSIPSDYLDKFQCEVHDRITNLENAIRKSGNQLQRELQGQFDRISNLEQVLGNENAANEHVQKGLQPRELIASSISPEGMEQLQQDIRGLLCRIGSLESVLEVEKAATPTEDIEKLRLEVDAQHARLAAIEHSSSSDKVSAPRTVLPSEIAALRGEVDALRTQQSFTLEAIALQGMKRVEDMFIDLRTRIFESKRNDGSLQQAAAAISIEHDKKQVRGKGINDIEANEHQRGKHHEIRHVVSQPQMSKELESRSRHIAAGIAPEDVQIGSKSISPPRRLSPTREAQGGFRDRGRSSPKAQPKATLGPAKLASDGYESGDAGSLAVGRGLTTGSKQPMAKSSSSVRARGGTPSTGRGATKSDMSARLSRGK